MSEQNRNLATIAKSETRLSILMDKNYIIDLIRTRIVTAKICLDDIVESLS